MDLWTELRVLAGLAGVTTGTLGVLWPLFVVVVSTENDDAARCPVPGGIKWWIVSACSTVCESM